MKKYLASLLVLLSFTATAQTKFNFALNWHPVGDHVAYWVAIDKGYYSQLGLDVTLENGRGSADSTTKVEVGRAEAGLADASTVIGARSRGANVKIIGMVFDTSPMNFFSHPDSPVKVPKDLEGKSIGAPPGDANRVLFPAFAKKHGIDESTIKWTNLMSNLKPVLLRNKSVDVVADFITGRYGIEKALGVPVQTMMWSDWGIDLYGMSIITSEKMLQTQPKTLERFLEASYKGWQFAMTNPEEALAIFKRRVPEADIDVIGNNMRAGFKLMQTKRYAKHGIGYIEKSKMCSTVETVNLYMALPRKVSCEESFTTSLLPKVALPK